MLGAVQMLAGVGETAPTAVLGKTASVKPAADVGSTFAEALASVSMDTIDKLKTAEAASIRGVTGNASVQTVVHSILSAEQSLQAAIAVRDRIVSAYQEISRMAI